MKNKNVSYKPESRKECARTHVYLFLLDFQLPILRASFLNSRGNDRHGPLSGDHFSFRLCTVLSRRLGQPIGAVVIPKRAVLPSAIAENKKESPFRNEKKTHELSRDSPVADRTISGLPRIVVAVND